MSTKVPLLSRDLEAARAAYRNNDSQLSKTAHAAGGANALPHEEPEQSPLADFVKPLVFGALDGLVSCGAFVAGASGAGMAAGTLFAVGTANALGGAVSMAIGDYTSSRAENDLARYELGREAWEVKHNPQGEIDEMVEVYLSRGISEPDARTVAQTLAKYPDYWVRHMLVEELGIMPPNDGEGIAGAVAMFASFFVAAMVPLSTFLMSSDQHRAPGAVDFYKFGAALLVIAAILGAMRASMSGAWGIPAKARGAVTMMATASLSFLFAYVTGQKVESMMD